MFSEQLLERFFHPRWVGELSGGAAGSLGGAWARATEGLPTCGDVVQMDIRVVDGVITGARFRTQGCPVAIAASDAACELVTGQTLVAAQFLHVNEVIEMLGGIPPKREGCATAPVTALRSAVQRLSLGGRPARP